ncbi:hypothetical protein [Nocardioides sp. B-3]|uniref:hypothetical protein n=1 Tax=Nocardioides sp. B-3 TaxID=2895565 RepID=UPI0021523986|nr:hypothetical protein [Nocardioides sp. B-3]UUZ60264.1 hypothetical protein LP418_04855 [Nocardioides sp. B-3]
MDTSTGADEADEQRERADLRQRRLAKAASLAAEQSSVISRPQLLALGVTRGQIRANIAARRWQKVRSRVIAVHTGELTTLGLHWAAVLEAGPQAGLDGASSLIASGLRGFDEESLRISVPRNARRRRGKGLNIHQTRRFRAEDQMKSGVPRTAPHVAAVHGALWAKSEKQAVLILTMPVQQGLTTADRSGRGCVARAPRQAKVAHPRDDPGSARGGAVRQ